jgi:hypothetical protein
LLLCNESAVEQCLDQALGVPAVGGRAGDQDPVVDRADQLLDQETLVQVRTQPLPLDRALQPGPG